MADVLNDKKCLDKSGLVYYDGKIKKHISDADAATLKTAKEYADGLADNYDAAGTAQTKVDELKNGAVKDNADAIAKLNGANTVEGSVAKAVKDASDAINTKIGTVPEGKTVVKLIEEAKTAATYDDTQVKSDIAKNAEGVAANKTALETLNGTGVGSVTKAVADAKDALQKQIDANKTILDKLDGEETVEGSVKKQIKDAVKTASGDLQKQVTVNKDAIAVLNGDATKEGSVAKAVKDASDALDAKITKNTDAIQAHKDAVDAKVTTLVGEDTNKSVRTIANEELAAQLIPENAKESLNTLQEIAAWIQKHPDDATAMNNSITALQTLVGTIPEGATATDIVNYIKELVDAEKTRATGVEGGLDTRLKAVEGLVGEGGSVADKIATAKQEAIDAAAADATTKAGTAETNAKGYADTKVKELADGQVATNKTDITALDGRVKTLESVSYVAITTEEIDALFTTAGDTTVTA